MTFTPATAVAVLHSRSAATPETALAGSSNWTSMAMAKSHNYGSSSRRSAGQPDRSAEARHGLAAAEAAAGSARMFGGFEGWSLRIEAPAKADPLVGGCSGDACGSYHSVALLDTDPSGYDLGTTPLDGSDPPRSSCFCRHAEWGMMKDVAAVTAAAGPAAAAAAAAALVLPPDLSAAPWARPATQWVAEDAVDGTNELLVDVVEDDNDVDDDDDDEAEIRSLLRPGGSPCLPLEEGWLMPAAVGGLFPQLPQLPQLGLGHANSSNEERCQRNGLPEAVECGGGGGCATGSGVCGGQDKATASCRRRCAPPPPPMSRHRACQMGYTDSAPARGTAATGVTADVGLAFMRCPGGAASPELAGGTLSAPPGAVAAAATATRKPGAVAEQAPSVSGLGDMCHAMPMPGALDEADAAAASSFLAIGTSVEFLGKDRGQSVCGCAAPASAATAVTARPPPLRSAAAAIGHGARRSWNPSAASPASRWSSAIAAVTGASDRASHAMKKSCALSSSICSQSTNGDARPSRGFFGSALADGLPTLLAELAGTHDGADEDHTGRTLSFELAAKVEQPAPGGAVARRARRFGRGLLACFSGR